MSFNFAFLLPLFAGLSTMIGYLFIYKKEHNNVLISSLAFASGVMFCVSILDLIPESIKELLSVYKLFPTILLSLIGINIGFIISNFFDKKIHFNEESKLYKIGFISMLAIIIHNIPEGIITYMTTTIDIHLGINLSMAIALHNIPEGISIAVPIYYATKNKKKAFLYTFISAISEPLGALLAHLFLSNFITSSFIGLLYSIIAGIMLFISLFELFPESLSYKKKNKTIIFFLIGIIIMYISLKLF